jgi:hypothetical protein
MPRIPREVIEHHLKIYPDGRLIQQRPRKQSVEWQNIIREEIKKLLNAGFIREVHHARWLANPVVVPKANGKLRMCIDYTSLLVPKILFLANELTRSWIPPQVVICYVS